MRPEFDANKNIRAYCDRCHAVSVFQRDHGGSPYGHFGPCSKPGSPNEDGYNNYFYRLYKCAGCNRGGLGELASPGPDEHSARLERFHPTAIRRESLPEGAPSGVLAEIAEAAECADAGAYRGATALLRSALEKTLKANGYRRGDLKQKINNAAKDLVITNARRERAHSNVRALGNDIVHDDWRAVTADEFEVANQYVHRIVEDFYEHRDEVVKLLTEKRRLTAEGAAADDRSDEGD